MLLWISDSFLFFCSVLFMDPFPNKPWFLRVCSTSLLKTLWEKEKLIIMSIFSFSHSAFYPFGELSAFFIKLKKCRLQALSIWMSLKFVVWEKAIVKLKLNFTPRSTRFSQRSVWVRLSNQSKDLTSLCPFLQGFVNLKVTQPLIG